MYIIPALNFILILLKSNLELALLRKNYSCWQHSIYELPLLSLEIFTFSF